MTPAEREYYYSGKVELDAKTGGPDVQAYCVKGYVVEVRRNDDLPLSEMELRGIIDNLSWAIIGEESLIDLERRPN